MKHQRLTRKAILGICQHVATVASEYGWRVATEVKSRTSSSRYMTLVRANQTLIVRVADHPACRFVKHPTNQVTVMRRQDVSDILGVLATGKTSGFSDAWEGARR